MNTINLHATNPLRNADADEPETLFKAAETLGQWDKQALHWADIILAEWISDAFANPKNREGWAELHSLIERLQTLLPAASHPEELRPTVEAYYYRWDGMAELLLARSHRQDNHEPEDIAKRAHMDTLKSATATYGPDLPVSDLPAHLQLSKSRVSQLLSLAEAGGLIERSKIQGKRVINLAGLWAPAAKQGHLSFDANYPTDLVSPDLLKRFAA